MSTVTGRKRKGIVGIDGTVKGLRVIVQ